MKEDKEQKQKIIVNILVGNGLFTGVLLGIPIVINLHEHRFVIYTLVLEIHDSVNMVLGIKNM